MNTELAMIYRHAHRDYKGKVGNEKAILVLRNGGTYLVPMTALTNEEVERMLPYAMKKEAARKRVVH